MSEYTRIAERARAMAQRYECAELAADWEWAQEDYIRAVRQMVILDYKIKGEPLPNYRQLSHACREAAETRLREVQA